MSSHITTPAEHLIISRYCFTGDGIKYDDPLYHRKSVGDTIIIDYGGFGCGHCVEKVTRKTEDGLYGYTIEDTMQELTLADVR